MWDLLKKRSKHENKRAQSRAFIKIFNNRMPYLKQLLSDWDYYDYESWALQNISDKLWVYTNKSKKEYLAGITPIIDYRDFITFKNVREDRLKCEIFINLTFTPSPGSESHNVYEITADVDVTVTLGDKEILTFKKDEDDLDRIYWLIASYYGNKERLKEQNIYTTLRFNGMSIRSYIYSVNRLGDQSLNDMVFDMGGRKNLDLRELSEDDGINRWKGKFVTFAHLVEYLTGNTLFHYGGAQTKLFKKEDKKQINLREAAEIAHVENIKSICLKQFKKDAPYIPYTNMVVAGTAGRITDGFDMARREILKLDLEELRKSDFSYTLEVKNTARTRDKKRRIKTRDVKIKDKEKGDWEASFEVVDVEILNLNIDVYVNNKRFTNITISNPRNFLYLLQDKLPEFKSTFDYFGWHRRPYVYEDNYGYRRMHGKRGVKARSPDKLTYKKIRDDMISGKIGTKEGIKLIESLYDTNIADLKPQQYWKKKLRRKQYPVQMAFLHYQNKYTLYNIQKLQGLFQGWRKQ